MWSVGRPGTGPLRLWNPPYYLVFRLRVCRFLPYSRIPYSVPDCVQARTTSHRTRLPDTRMETSGDLRKKLNKAPAPKDSPFAAVAAASPPVPPAAMLTPSIPKDSPFSNSTAAPTTVSQPAAPAKPFTFSFALDTTTQKNTVATYNLAAPIAPVDTSSLQPTVATIGAKNSHKIGRARRGKPRPSNEDEGEEGEDEEDSGGGPSGRSDGEGGAPLPSRLAKASGTTSVAGAMNFDSSTFDLSGFAMSLGDPALPLSTSTCASTEPSQPIAAKPG